MTHDADHSHDDTHELPDALRWQLRALRQDQAPTHDLWTGIAPRLAARTDARAVEVRSPAVPVSPRWRVPVALAASVLVALGTLGLLRYGGPSADQQAALAARAMDARALAMTSARDQRAIQRPITAGTPLALAEAEGLRRQYEGAIRELEIRPGSNAADAALRTLDQSAELILAALRQAPDSTHLLEQLRRTYQRRIELMRLPLA